MAKIIDYTLVGSNDHSIFISFVKQHTTEGWQPFEAAKLWQWGAGGQAQPFVTLVARKPHMVRFNPSGEAWRA